jgi:hypothetical protein
VPAGCAAARRFSVSAYRCARSSIFPDPLGVPPFALCPLLCILRRPRRARRVLLLPRFDLALLCGPLRRRFAATGFKFGRVLGLAPLAFRHPLRFLFAMALDVGLLFCFATRRLGGTLRSFGLDFPLVRFAFGLATPRVRACPPPRTVAVRLSLAELMQPTAMTRAWHSAFSAS